MKNETTATLKGGVNYDESHILAHKIAIEGLLGLGILKGDKDEILAARTSAAFFPHGLGHHLGMDCHDTGGGQNRADPDKLFPNLRLRGIVPAGSVVTIEPGVSIIQNTVHVECRAIETRMLIPPDLLLRIHHQALPQRPCTQPLH